MSEWLLAAAVSLGLVIVVWWDLVSGGGLVGGDIYPYFLPQKMVVSDAFASGSLPLWHPFTGLGYPLHAESQAGIFYPPTQLLYRLFDLNTAYNANLLIHYWLAFIFAWRLGRAEGLTRVTALLAAAVFVYGWFPARISWEWSIVGGVWLPLTMWLTRRLLLNPSGLRFVLLALCLGAHLLAGHFTLAFINHVSIVVYVVLSRWRGRLDGDVSWRAAALPILAIVASLGVAGIQLVPTFELKSLSQREQIGEEFNPAYGHMPPAYISQVAASWWYWHSAEARAGDWIQQADRLVDAGTNPVEAHLYWGMIPLTLILFRFVSKSQRGNSVVWWGLLIFGVVYATGALLPVTQYLPGFGFFRGPGRFTIMAALAGAILAGRGLDLLLSRKTKLVRHLVAAVVFVITVPDLLWSSMYTRDAVIVDVPPIRRLDDSWVRKFFANRAKECRLLAPGPNVANLYGVSCVPQYLGIGPEIYYDPQLTPQSAPSSDSDIFPTDAALLQLRRLGVTHILTTEPIAKLSPEVETVSAFPDSLLNSVWGRGLEPCYLYALISSPPRVVSKPEEALQEFSINSAAADRIEFSVTLSQDATVVLKDLMYPGWKVEIDGQEAAANPVDLSLKAVDVSKGTHTLVWTFQPRSVWLGALLSASTFLLLFFIALRFRSSRVVAE